MEVAKIKCPECGHVQEIEIPKNKCLTFYLCEGCKKTVSAKDCCVICDYSDKRCETPHS